LQALLPTLGKNDGYGLSKAALSIYAAMTAKQYPNLVSSTISPGFVDTQLTAGFGGNSKLTPE